MPWPSARSIFAIVLGLLLCDGALGIPLAPQLARYTTATYPVAAVTDAIWVNGYVVTATRNATVSINGTAASGSGGNTTFVASLPDVPTSLFLVTPTVFGVICGKSLLMFDYMCRPVLNFTVADGTLDLQFNPASQAYLPTSGPLVLNGTVYVGSRNTSVNGFANVYAVNTSGVKWWRRLSGGPYGGYLIVPSEDSATVFVRSSSTSSTSIIEAFGSVSGNPVANFTLSFSTWYSSNAPVFNWINGSLVVVCDSTLYWYNASGGLEHSVSMSGCSSSSNQWPPVARPQFANIVIGCGNTLYTYSYASDTVTSYSNTYSIQSGAMDPFGNIVLATSFAVAVLNGTNYNTSINPSLDGSQIRGIELLPGFVALLATSDGLLGMSYANGAAMFSATSDSLSCSGYPAISPDLSRVVVPVSAFNSVVLEGFYLPSGPAPPGTFAVALTTSGFSTLLNQTTGALFLHSSNTMNQLNVWTGAVSQLYDQLSSISDIGTVDLGNAVCFADSYNNKLHCINLADKTDNSATICGSYFQNGYLAYSSGAFLVPCFESTGVQVVSYPQMTVQSYPSAGGYYIYGAALTADSVVVSTHSDISVYTRGATKPTWSGPKTVGVQAIAFTSNLVVIGNSVYICGTTVTPSSATLNVYQFALSGSGTAANSYAIPFLATYLTAGTGGAYASGVLYAFNVTSVSAVDAVSGTVYFTTTLATALTGSYVSTVAPALPVLTPSGVLVVVVGTTLSGWSAVNGSLLWVEPDATSLSPIQCVGGLIAWSTSSSVRVSGAVSGIRVAELQYRSELPRAFVMFTRPDNSTGLIVATTTVVMGSVLSSNVTSAAAAGSLPGFAPSNPSGSGSSSNVKLIGIIAGIVVAVVVLAIVGGVIASKRGGHSHSSDVYSSMHTPMTKV